MEGIPADRDAERGRVTARNGGEERRGEVRRTLQFPEMITSSRDLLHLPFRVTYPRVGLGWIWNRTPYI
jgi:hypothetical protein